jgi:hypothetical protein
MEDHELIVQMIRNGFLCRRDESFCLGLHSDIPYVPFRSVNVVVARMLRRVRGQAGLENTLIPATKIHVVAIS